MPVCTRESGRASVSIVRVLHMTAPWGRDPVYFENVLYGSGEERMVPEYVRPGGKLGESITRITRILQHERDTQPVLLGQAKSCSQVRITRVLAEQKGADDSFIDYVRARMRTVMYALDCVAGVLKGEAKESSATSGDYRDGKVPLDIYMKEPAGRDRYLLVAYIGSGVSYWYGDVEVARASTSGQSLLGTVSLGGVEIIEKSARAAMKKVAELTNTIDEQFDTGRLSALSRDTEHLVRGFLGAERHRDVRNRTEARERRAARRAADVTTEYGASSGDGGEGASAADERH